jgi:hypothetical protein
VTAPIPAPPLPQEPDGNEPPVRPAVVEEMLKLFVKAVRAHQLYLPNNPTYHRAIEVLRAAFIPIWDVVDSLPLQVQELEFKYHGHAVLREDAKSSDSLPWLFFKDGVRMISIQRDFELEELTNLLDILQRVRKASPDEDDLLTMLWEGEFAYLKYQYVDLAMESATPLEAGDSIPERVDSSDEGQVGTAGAPSESVADVVNMADFDSSLYFLDDGEIEYLQSAVRSEYARDHRPNIVAALLDIFELQTSKPTREELLGILESFMLHLLSGSQFRSVAYLLRETAQAAPRAREIDPSHRERLTILPARLSEPESLSQLLQALDESSELPPQADLDELFQQFRPTALESVFSWLGRLQTAQLRSMLESAAERLASQNTGELVKLITVADATVALEAIRRSGAMKAAAAVPSLAKVLQDPSPQVRLAAALALGEIGSAGAMQALEKAVDDSDRDVRVATARALGSRAYKPALPRIETAVKGKQLRERDLTEKMAFFEAYGALCGDGGVSLLDGILNSKSFLGRREDPELRACAAMALGRIGSQKAQESLRQSSGEKEVLVRNAVNRALRGEAGTPR